MELLPMGFILCWLGAGFLSFVIGNFLSWWGGKDLQLGELALSLLTCLFFGGVAFVCVGLYLLSKLFNAHIVLVRGRGRCVECDLRGHHKMSCSQRYKELGDA